MDPELALALDDLILGQGVARGRRKLFASERRRTDNQEWAVQIAPGSQEIVWACPERKERHDVETVVPVNP